MLCAIQVLLLTSHLVMGDSNNIAVNNFFPGVNGNLTKVTWAHAVNNKAYLEQVFNSNVMMIEADVIMGKLNGGGVSVPVMGHPPADTSDLSLEMFLDRVVAFNGQSPPTHKKGIKLDFKSIEVLDRSVAIVQRHYDKMNFPLWFNADIFAGPKNATTTPVDAERFFEQTGTFKNAVLSLGWTTNYGNATHIVHAQYTTEQIDAMLDIIARLDVDQTVTFAVRAGIAAESLDLMRLLVGNVTRSTLTIWSSPGDVVNVDKLRTLIFGIGVDRVYIDVPGELLQQLHLDKSGGMNMSPLNLFASMATALLLYILNK